MLNAPSRLVSLLVQAEKGVTIGHRGRFEIIANILSIATNGAKKTQLMYKCNMSFKQLEVYLNLCTEKRLVAKRIHNGSKDAAIYEITNKGLSFLHAYRTLKALMTV
jgi:predicted transcriptional regulator